MLKLKDGVVANGLKPETILILLAAIDFFNSIGKDCVVTSITDSKHSRTSLHYVGYAIDFRTRHLTDIEKNMFLNHLNEALPTEEYDFVLEKDHLHSEFQPKR